MIFLSGRLPSKSFWHPPCHDAYDHPRHTFCNLDFVNDQKTGVLNFKLSQDLALWLMCRIPHFMWIREAFKNPSHGKFPLMGGWRGSRFSANLLAGHRPLRGGYTFANLVETTILEQILLS